jgi:hypothetical protein
VQEPDYGMPKLNLKHTNVHGRNPACTKRTASFAGNCGNLR